MFRPMIIDWSRLAHHQSPGVISVRLLLLEHRGSTGRSNDGTVAGIDGRLVLTPGH